MTSALKLRDLTLGYGSNPVVHGVSLEVRTGTVHVLAGENGSGKSTLLGALSGRLTPWSGEIRIDGEPYEFSTPRDAIAAGVALVSQELSLIPDMSIAENLGVGSYRGSSRLFHRAAVVADVSQYLRMVGLDTPATTRVSTLTAHERQLVEIARALATGARIILLDEPTSSLDLAEVDKLFASVSALRSQGYTFILITHRTRELHAIADEVSVLRDGRLIDTRPIGEVNDDWLVRSLVGREMSTLFPARSVVADAAPVLEVASLFDAEGCVNDATLTVRAGEIVALAGLVGAGRSELLETVFGARQRRSGEVRLCGEPLVGGPARALRQGVAMIFEERKRQGIVPALSNADNFSLSTSPVPIVPRGRERSALRRWRERLSIRGREEQAIGTLSGGNQQKVLLARALELQPRLLLLDEPTRGVDVGAKADIYSAVSTAADAGCAVLLATSELEEALGLADRILVLRDGRIVDEQIGETATEQSVIAAATGMTEVRTETPHD